MSGKFSVVIPLFNKGLYIARTLDSVLKQTFQDFEVIVVDDGSTDNGAEIVRGFNDIRVQLIRQINQGESAARNRGVDESKSDFVAFLDADDEWMPKHLETIVRLIDKFPCAGIFTTAWKWHTASGEIFLANYKYIPNLPWEGILPDYFKSGAFGDSPVNSSTAVIPKKIFIEAGGFPKGYWWGPDIDLWGRIALKYPVAFSWECGAIYHCDALNRVYDKGFPLDYQEPFIKTARTALIKREVPQNLIDSLNEYIWIKEYVRAVRNVQAGNSDAAQNILKQCKIKGHNFETMKLLLIAKLPYPLYLFMSDAKRKIIKRSGNKNSSIVK